MARKKNVIAPNNKKVKVIAPEARAMDKLKLTREQADKLWGDGQPFDLVRVETRIGTNNSTVIEGMVASGRDYLWAKAHVNHGEFMALVDRTANSHTYVLNCMRFADMYRNSAPVPNLGVRKTKALTLLDKPVVEEYLKGGSLGDIPHDDVSEMPVSQLEEEVRKLREKVKKTETIVNEKIRQKDEQINKLEMELEHRQPPTKSQLAQAELENCVKDYRDTLLEAVAGLSKANTMLNQRIANIEGIDVQMVNEWLNQFNLEMELMSKAYQGLTDFIDEPYLPKLYKK